MTNIQYLDRLTAPTIFGIGPKVEKSAKGVFFAFLIPKQYQLIEVFFWFHIFSGKKTILMNLGSRPTITSFGVVFGRSRRAENI